MSVGSVLNGNADVSAYFAGHVGIGRASLGGAMLAIINKETGGNYYGINVTNNEASANIYGLNIDGTSAYGIRLDANADDNCFDSGAAALCAINDYAEMMEFSETPTDGDIITVDTDNPGLLKISDKANDSLIVGVASKNPAMVIGSYGVSIKGWNATTTKDGHPVYPLALVGRKIIKISDENGPIKVGDRITASSLKGYGMKATESGNTLGTALWAFNQETSTTTATLNDGTQVKTGKILVLINLGYSKLDDGIAALAESSEVEPHYGGSTSLNWSIDQTTGKVTAGFTGGLDLGGNSLQNVSAIMSASGNWRIDENGNLVVKKVMAEEVETKKLKVGAQEKPEGITIYDELTGQPGCVKLRGGVVQTDLGECGATSTQ